MTESANASVPMYANECTDDITIGFLLVIVRFLWTTVLMQNTETQ